MNHPDLSSSSKRSAREAIANVVEDVAGRLSLASSPDDIEQAVNDLLTIAKNVRSGVVGV